MPNSNRGVFDLLSAYIHLREPDQQLLQDIRRLFADALVPTRSPSKIDYEIARGKPMRFESKNSAQVEYLRNLDLLYAIAWELYPKG